MNSKDVVVAELEALWNREEGCSIRLQHSMTYACRGGFVPLRWNISIAPDTAAEGEATDTKIEVTQDENIAKEESNESTPSSSIQDISETFDALWEIVLGSVAGRIGVGTLQHDLAADTLCQKLQSGRFTSIDAIEFHNGEISYKTDENKKQAALLEIDNKQRVMDLCCKLLRKGPATLQTVYFKDLAKKYDAQTIKELFQCLQKNTTLQTFDARSSRYIHSWNRICSGYHNASREKESDFSIEPLISALLNNENVHAMKRLDLSGNHLSKASAVQLAKALHRLGLKELLLRETELDEESLLELARSIRSDSSLRLLNISCNLFSPKVMEEMTTSLQQNKTLETLVMDHCNIDLEQIQCFSRNLPNMLSLRHLSLNGNPFTWYPILNGVYQNGKLIRQMSGQATADESSDDDWALDAIGFVLLIKAIKRQQENGGFLVSLEAGDDGNICGLSYVCCSTPQYCTILSPSRNKRLRRCLQENKKAYKVFLETRQKEAVVKIAGLLLEKTQAN